MELLYTARFIRSLKKLPEPVIDDCLNAIELFKKGERAALKYHKLKGRMTGLHAFSANFSYRIVVEEQKGKVYCLDVGSHAVYE
jgi:hypothetical protein